MEIALSTTANSNERFGWDVTGPHRDSVGDVFWAWAAYGGDADRSYQGGGRASTREKAIDAAQNAYRELNSQRTVP
jgi:hypothetical protein